MAKRFHLSMQERMMTSSLFRRNNDDVIMRSWLMPLFVLPLTVEVTRHMVD